MGVVYEVVHARTGEHLALKVLLASAGALTVDLHRFKQEARASAKIKSEHVVRVLDADTAPELNGAPFLVMELLEGLDLEQAATLSPPGPATVIEWLLQIAPALDKAHRLGIVHRDLKPDNLFLTNVEGRPPIVKILDFGIAKITDESSTATASGQVLGTPKYMAPEQVSQNSKVTGATDLYALGLVAYRLLLGESYYRGPVMGVLAELLHGVAYAPSVRHPQLSAEFDNWFLQACHRDPARRFTSASQQIEALAVALEISKATRAAEPIATATATASQPPSKRRLVALGGAGAAVVAAAAVAYGTLYGRERAPNALPEPQTQLSPPETPRPEVKLPPTLPPKTEPSDAPPREVHSPEAVPAAAAPSMPAPRRNKVPANSASPGSTPTVVPDPYQDQK